MVTIGLCLDTTTIFYVTISPKGRRIAARCKNIRDVILPNGEISQISHYIPLIGKTTEDVIGLKASNAEEIDITLLDFTPNHMAFDEHEKIVGLYVGFPSGANAFFYFEELIAEQLKEVYRDVQRKLHEEDPTIQIVDFKLCVAIPAYWTEYHVHVFTKGAKLAGMKISRLTLQCHTGSMQWFAIPEHRQSSILLVDVGYSGMQVAYCKYNSTSSPAHQIFEGTDSCLGGKLMDMILYQHFRKEMIRSGIPDPHIEWATREELMRICILLKEGKNVCTTSFIDFRFEITEECRNKIRDYFNPKINRLMEALFDQRMTVLELPENEKYSDLQLIKFNGHGTAPIQVLILNYLRSKNVEMTICT